MNTIRWINPEATEAATGVAPPSESVSFVPKDRPLRVGLLENTKDNARLLLERIAEEVRREIGAESILRRKENPATPAAPELMDELADSADCVLTAMAD